ncbi:hypothetical protein CQW23_22493 [Capsicum baccatum]|uniref:S-protein homolog n=1 Tax=Capsicum baccatum TaxID=33114 RepID=A0A2G2W111_CAPBA|nr:hypothetical protein CQW23_22493 [Capsicum baccatum]
MPCSSNHHHHNIVLCLFLLSFLSVTNSQSWPDFFFASITNETPKLDVLARCYLNGEDYRGGASSIEPGDARAYQGDIVPGKNNTISCDVKLGNNHGFFRMFDLNDTSICHTPNTSDCHWYVQEDGLCCFLSVTNSQSSLKDFRVSIENETPKLDVLARCYEDGEKPGGEFFAISPGWIADFDILIDHGRTNTFSCDLKLGKKHETFRMFDLKNTSICHNFGEKCHWNVREDGACLLMKVVVVVAAVVVAGAAGAGAAAGAAVVVVAVVVVVVVVFVAVVVAVVVVVVVVVAVVAVVSVVVVVVVAAAIVLFLLTLLKNGNLLFARDLPEEWDRTLLKNENLFCSQDPSEEWNRTLLKNGNLFCAQNPPE